MIASRAPVEVLLGDAADVVRGIEGDFALLEEGRRASRAWTCTSTAVVLGVGRTSSGDVDEAECRARGAALLRRASGGGTVVIGPGTLQYAFVLPHEAGREPPGLGDVKRLCNEAVCAALRACGVAAVETEPSGDLRCGDRKVGGVALRRHRDATMLHGTLLLEADLQVVAALLRHPSREPAWRKGRSHLAFLAGLGHIDEATFAEALRAVAPR
jgi:lipoate---protein ligase